MLMAHHRTWMDSILRIRSNIYIYRYVICTMHAHINTHRTNGTLVASKEKHKLASRQPIAEHSQSAIQIWRMQIFVLDRRGRSGKSRPIPTRPFSRESQETGENLPLLRSWHKLRIIRSLAYHLSSSIVGQQQFYIAPCDLHEKMYSVREAKFFTNTKLQERIY